MADKHTQVDWRGCSLPVKVNLLAQESTVLPELLMGSPELMVAIKTGESLSTCLKIVNDNF